MWIFVGEVASRLVGVVLIIVDSPQQVLLESIHLCQCINYVTMQLLTSYTPTEAAFNGV